LAETQTNLAELSHILCQVTHKNVCKISNLDHDHSYPQLSISPFTNYPTTTLYTLRDRTAKQTTHKTVPWPCAYNLTSITYLVSGVSSSTTISCPTLINY